MLAPAARAAAAERSEPSFLLRPNGVRAVAKMVASDMRCEIKCVKTGIAKFRNACFFSLQYLFNFSERINDIVGNLSAFAGCTFKIEPAGYNSRLLCAADIGVK